MEIKYHEVDFETVARYWAKDYGCEAGKEIWKVETFYDPNKGKIIFKIYEIDEKAEDKDKP